MEIATTKLSSRGQIVIPVEMRKHLKEGDNLVIIGSESSLIIKKEEDLALEWKDVKVLADTNLLAKDWLSEEDEKAFAYLQKR